MKYKKVRLKEFANVNMGQSPKSEFYNTKGEGMPFLQGVRTFGDMYPYIDTFTTKAHKIAEKGEILFTVRAPVGDVNICPEKICIGRGLASISSENNIFLYYLLRNSKKKFNNVSTGTIYSSINKKELENLEFMIPNNEDCIKIANILFCLDKKIEVNNKIIANLEEQAQAIFKSWFVDFEPFQDGNFVESEQGMIPEGWEVSITGEEFNIEYGKNLPTKNLLENGYPVYGGNGQIGFYNKYLYSKPRLLVSCRGAASGKVGLSKAYSFVTNNSLVFNEKIDEYFYYYKYLFNSIVFENYVTGSAQPQLTIKNSTNIKILVPNKNSICNFNKIIEGNFKEQNILDEENKKLAEIRDALLPKLMSGEIDVSNIKIKGEEVKNEWNLSRRWFWKNLYKIYWGLRIPLSPSSRTCKR